MRVPELQIVSDELWEAVKARQAEVRIVMSRDADSNALRGAHRRKFLLSGLLECGVCGGGVLNWPPFRPDIWHEQGGLGISPSTGTSVAESVSKDWNAATSASALAGSLALRSSGRLWIAVQTGPLDADGAPRELPP